MRNKDHPKTTEMLQFFEEIGTGTVIITLQAGIPSTIEEIIYNKIVLGRKPETKIKPAS